MLFSRRAALPTLILLGLAPLATSLSADEPELTGDLKAIQGTWISKDETGEATWEFKGKSLSLNAPGRAYKLTITLDPEAKPLKKIDFVGEDDSPNAKGFKAPGIYKFDGETKLTICFGSEDSGRPDEFKGDFQEGSFLFELTKK
jgi:uncharacterized protein (TIGR03067 family)